MVASGVGRVSESWERYQLVERRLGNLQRLAASRDELTQSDMLWERAPKPYFVAESRAVGATALQSEISRLAAESNLQVVSARPVDDLTPLDQGLSELVLELQFRASMVQLATFLDRLRGLRRITVAREVSIRRLSGGRRSIDRPLSVRLRLHAVFLEAP